MRFGVFAFPVAGSLEVPRLAVGCEERGFESLWFPDHSHIPLRRETPWPGGPELPEHYRQVFDPIAALGAAAAVTSRLRLGTGVLVLPQRDVIQTAKSIATLDALSGGRVLVGVGGGWNREEMRDHGVDPEIRWALLREKVLAMKQIWTDPHAGFQGRHVSFGPLDCGPATTDPAGPAVLVGGAAPGGIRRAVAWADGWMPLAGRGESDWADGARQLRAAAEAAGRDPRSVGMTVFGATPSAELVESVSGTGIERVVFAAPPADADTVLSWLDTVARLCRTI
jgi:probable F420-dependent oxidoreductase